MLAPFKNIIFVQMCTEIYNCNLDNLTSSYSICKITIVKLMDYNSWMTRLNALEFYLHIYL